MVRLFAHGSAGSVESFAPCAWGYDWARRAGAVYRGGDRRAGLQRTQFWAAGDGKTVDTPAINRAIEAVAAAGGGVLRFPAGTYMCFTIHLRSKVDLYLERGCTILAADSPKPGERTGYQGGVYDAAESNMPWEPYQDYGHNHWRNSLFYGEGLSDFSITGPGLIHGAGLSHGVPGRQ
jgi:polygalacturonase